MADKALTLTVPNQAQLNWCWAATTAGVHNYVFSKAVDQCDVVNHMLGHNDCCDYKTGDLPYGCDVQSGLTLPLYEYDCHKTTYANKIDFDEIIAEIEKGFPVCVRVVWEQGFGEGHFAVIVGYISDKADGGISDVVINDSYYGPSIQTFASFKQFYRTLLMTPEGDKVNEGVWTHTYFVAPAAKAKPKIEGSEA